MIKVEVHETDASISPPMSSSRSVPPQIPMTPTPPPSTSTGVNNRLIPNLPPLHLPGGGVRPSSTSSLVHHHPAAEQLMLNHTSELMAKQNMFFFGDVTVAEHPDAPPVPMVIPMVYLYPLQAAASANNKESIKYIPEKALLVLN